MNPEFFLKLRGLAVGAVVSLVGQLAAAEPQYAIAMYGQPALPPDFVALPYANVDAPFGGRVVTAEVGTFDSLNPFIQKGSVPWQLSYLVSETLMGRSLDEPFTLYGLLAESVDTGPNREWVEFTLRPEARFSDGSPVTVEDVIWSFETLGTQGHGRYAGFWGKVASIEATGERSVKITFSEADRELVMLAGLRPILQKAMWEGLDFAESGIDTIPITSGPYVVDSYEAGRFVVLKRNPDYWGQDIPFRRGTNVIDEIRMDFYADETAAREVGHHEVGHGFGRTTGDLGHGGVDAGGVVFGGDHRMRAGPVGDAQAGPQVVRVGHAVEHQQQRLRDTGSFELFEQLVERTHLCDGIDARHHALMAVAAAHFGEPHAVGLNQPRAKLGRAL